MSIDLELDKLMSSMSPHSYNTVYCVIDKSHCDVELNCCKNCKKARNYNKKWLVSKDRVNIKGKIRCFNCGGVFEKRIPKHEGNFPIFRVCPICKESNYLVTLDNGDINIGISKNHVDIYDAHNERNV